ncbi:2-hydroxyacyl-CoA dehydratase [Enterococcus sp. DIV1368e]|uniref:2-hydroxyacyl-CoA dehydratase n=1 Tax=unclassified Enterococcus TaxID=2608891 RepID=UPI003F28DE7C
MTKLKTSKVMEETSRKAIEQAKKQRFQIDKDDFEIVQPFDDGNAIIFSVEGSDDNRAINYEVRDAVIVLEKQEGTLDIFVSEEKE